MNNKKLKGNGNGNGNGNGIRNCELQNSKSPSTYTTVQRKTIGKEELGKIYPTHAHTSFFSIIIGG